MKETYKKITIGKCSNCGKTDIVKIENSSLSYFKHGHRYTYVDEDTEERITHIFKCSNCKQPIDDTFVSIEKRVYISGKITGLYNAEKLFEIAEKEINNFGFDAVNPMKLKHVNKNWSDCVKKDIIELCRCDTIYMLSNWKGSKGAILEHHIAKELKMEIIYQ